MIAFGVGLDPRSGCVPSPNKRLECVACPRQREKPLELARFERVEAPEDFRRLPERQAEVTPFKRNVREAHQRPRRRLLCGDPVWIHLNPRERDPRLDPSLHVDQRKLHVNGGCKLGLVGLELLELEDLARFGARSTLKMFHHQGILTKVPRLAKCPLRLGGLKPSSAVSEKPDHRSRMCICWKDLLDRKAA